MKFDINEEEKQWLDKTWEKIQKKIRSECERNGDIFPYISENGRYHDKMADNPYWWTNGFWPGILWLMYEATGEEDYLTVSRHLEAKLDKSLEGFEGLHHDVGFMWQLSAVADYRLTGNPRSRIRGLHAATLLAGRFNPKGKFIRAWNKEFTGRMIVDCMMNLALLYWAGEELNDPRFRFIAMEHADTCMKYIVREDGSCNHMADFNPETGEFLNSPGGQGYSAGSSWSRGQAWALYGFTISYLHTGEQRYLNTAKKIANYFLANVKLSDYIPLVDFRMPKEPVKYDTTAGMIAVCGLLELSAAVGEYEKTLYQDGAMEILRAEIDRCADWNPDTDGILQLGSAEYHKKPEEAHVPIIYGDYYMIEAIQKLRGSQFMPW